MKRVTPAPSASADNSCFPGVNARIADEGKNEKITPPALLRLSGDLGESHLHDLILGALTDATADSAVHRSLNCLRDVRRYLLAARDDAAAAAERCQGRRLKIGTVEGRNSCRTVEPLFG